MARSVAAHAGAFVATVGQIASRTAPEATFPVLLLATSDLLASGARLGAMVDVVPPLRYEPDTGPDADLDTLRIGLAEALEGFDEYAEVVDPVLGEEVGRASLSGDLATVTAALQQGLAHYDAGDVLEALWWWQFSYLSSWGERASSALRMLQLVLCHIRLDVEDDVAAEAEYDALQA
ncbi:DUF5063 domain-containing protein [Luteimicrobium subarcticum]|uniref:DUF5063 domain-containing protein n=1 Tax=Luteimicrobium subarcticum TaxID=620910 RepID=UPI001FEB0214|nr:DUF5063 domain-containing protein [Luteimicrobium subarcticum]